MTTMSEMSLEEVAAQYGSTHRAAKEYADLRARIAELEHERDKLQDALAITRNACASRKAQRDEYRHMAECAAITAFCGYFSRMRGPEWISVDDSEPEPMTPVLAAFREEGRSRSRVIRAVWCPAKYANTEEWNYLDDGAEYDEDSDASYWPEGWYEWNETEETHWMLHGYVTHWMDLPDVPDNAMLAAKAKGE